jgi:hypothetical protein
MDGRVEMMDLEIWKQYHEEMIREAERNRLAKELRTARKKRAESMKRWQASTLVARASGIWNHLLMEDRKRL